MRADFCHWMHTPFFRTVARTLIFVLLFQNFPADALRVAHADTPTDVLWVDLAGTCNGASPCFTSIQDAVDAAVGGETVRVLAGTYGEQLKIRNKNREASASERDRITIEADPNAAPGSVALAGPNDHCRGGYAVAFANANYVTLRGFTISGAGRRGIVLRGGSRASIGPRLERNRVLRGDGLACEGGIDLQRGNPDAVIANNLVYGLAKHAVRVRNFGESAWIVGNTIVRNGWNGLFLERGATAHVWNNILAFNGRTTHGRGGGRFGVRQRKATKPVPANVDLAANLICGNVGGEIDGVALDAADRGNLTPTGTEGPGVVASPRCDVASYVFQDTLGPDLTPDTTDDEFILTLGSPALDRGIDPRAEGTTLPDALFEADFLAPAHRPRGTGFDLGALETGQSTEPTAVATRSATPSPTVSATVTASPTPSATPTSTPTATTTPTVTVTRTVTVTPSPTPIVGTTPTPTAVVGVPTATRTTTPVRTVTATRTASAVPTASPTNHPPVAVDDTFSVEVGTTLTVPPPGVLANDTDPDLDPLTAHLLTPPALGQLSAFDANGGFTFQAPAAFVQPGLHATPLRRIPFLDNMFAQVADFDHDGTADVIASSFGTFMTLRGGDLSLLSVTDPTDTSHVDIRGCGLFNGNLSFAIGDIDDSGDVSLVNTIDCDDTRTQGAADRFVAFNGSKITNGKIGPTWVTERLTKPHPDAYVDQNATAPANPPIRPNFAAVGAAEPTLARLSAGGGVKLLAHTIVNRFSGSYLTKNPTSGAIEGRNAGCRSVTGDPADENQPCRATWIIDAATGAVEQVLRGPNDANEFNIGNGFPWSQNAPIVADLDGDGAVEIVAGGDVFTQVNGTWQLAWHTTYEPANIAVADLDGDGTQEVVQYQYNFGPGRDFHEEDGGIFIYAHDGALIRRIPAAVGQAAFGFLTIADADGDGAPDILFTAHGILYAYRADGRLLWAFLIPDRPVPIGVFVPAPTDLNFRNGRNSPQVYDLDLDDRPEVILNTSARLFILDGRTGLEKDSFDNEGSGFSPDTVALADFDGDGHVDILSVSTDRWNCSVLTGGPVPCEGNVMIVGGANHDWAPGPKVFNQMAFRANAVDDDAKILFAPGARRDFRQPAQQGTVVDHRFAGGTTFSYEANDGHAASNPATAFVKIRPANSGPEITSTPPSAILSQPPYPYFVYQITATDPDPGDVLHYELVGTSMPYGTSGTSTTVLGSNGVVVNPDTGAVSIFTGREYRDIAIAVAAIDSLGARAEQTFLVTISANTVTVPTVVGQLLDPAITALQNVQLRARVIDEVFSASPKGAVVNQTPAGGTTGVVIGTTVDLVLSKGPVPTPAPTATPSRTPDPNATVTPIPPIDSIVVEPANQILIQGQTQQYVATAVFGDGTAADVSAEATWDSSMAAAATVSGTGLATAITAGTTTISATFAGKNGGTMLTVLAKVPSDSVDPVAEITSPAGGSEVIQPVDVVGTATDANFAKYELALALAGETDFTIIETGNAPVTNGVLGQLDPTLLINDLYDLKLTVYDRNGNITEAQIGVQVTREQKIGLFTYTFVDLDLPLSGIPITISRTYDSRDKARGDFGVGWRLSIASLRVRANREQGSGWYVDRIGGGFGAYVLKSSAEHSVSVTLPDGNVETFDLVISPAVSPLTPLETVTARYVPRAGTLGTLEALADNDLLVIGNQPGDVELVTFATADTYDPKLFRYTRPDGQSIDVHRSTGVQRIEDTNGNTLTFGPTGIVHSSGTSVLFDRDGEGRITKITDPGGHSQSYQYDLRGDLIGHTDAVGNTTRFTYNRAHGLIDIIDPTGNRPLRNEYDADGRLIATVDAQGHRVQFTHDLSTSQEIQTDRLGHVTVFEYNATGRVVTKTNALGGVTAFTYDAQGNPLTETDPLGRTSTRTYDAAGNVLTQTDFEGNTTTSTYDERGRLLTGTDAEGRTTTNVYDPQGNLTESTDPDGNETHYTYDAAGNQLTVTDPLGHVTTSTYDGAGNRLSKRDPLGQVTTYTYDANGRLLTETDPAGHTTHFEYDANGRRTKTIDPAGGTKRTSYDANGKTLTTTDALGRVTTYLYDARGHLTRTTYADGSAATVTYDLEGHPITSTDRRGLTTTTVYDALARAVKVTNPDGTVTLRTYDAGGRVATSTDERGNVTTVGRTANQESRIDALGHVSTKVVDSQGRTIRTTDALGRVVELTYDGRGNPIATVAPDGSTVTLTYDAAGRKTAITDQAGNSTHFEYDADDRLTRVTDAEGQVTTYAYDVVGNRTEEIDANGHVTRLEYDAVGHVTKRVRPLGQEETFTYDLAGNQLSHTDFNGRTTTFEYDSDDRLTAKHLPDGTTIASAFCGCGLRTMAGGDTFAYDDRGRLILETKAGGAQLSYGYDAAGNRTSMTTPQGTTTYTYDALNRLQTVTDDTGSTAYAYDAVGNLASTIYPNGTTTAYAYDDLNRLVSMENTGPGGLLSSYTYTLGPVGNRVRVVEAGTATTGRTVTYEYDAILRLTKEIIDEPGAANDQTITYTYDGVGNRHTMDRNGTITTSTFDDNDRLTEEKTGAAVTTFTYDGNGSLTTRTIGATVDLYTYDDERRLIDADLQTGVNPESASYTYDADGVRTSKTAGGDTTTFLVDKNRNLSQVVLEATGPTVVAYTYGLDLVSQTRTGTGTRFYQYDGQHSTRQLTDTTGAVTDRYTYDAFGVGLQSVGSTPNLYLYGGQQLDPNVGFYYLRARYYAQATGRFVTTDPVHGSIFDPPTLHQYLYAGANPVMNADPSGEFLPVLVAGIIAFLGMLAVVLDITAAIVGGGRYFTTDFAKKILGGRTDKFLLRTCGGFTAGLGVDVTAQTVVIGEQGVTNPSAALYTVSGWGGGAGLSVFAPSGKAFSTKGTRRFSDFAGEGTLFTLGAGLYIAQLFNVFYLVLPDETPVDLSSGPDKGTNKAIEVGGAAFRVTWEFAESHPGYFYGGKLNCHRIGGP